MIDLVVRSGDHSRKELFAALELRDFWMVARRWGALILIEPHHLTSPEGA